MTNFKITENTYNIDINDIHYNPESILETISIYLTSISSLKNQQKFLNEISTNNIFDDIEYVIVLNDSTYELQMKNISYNHRLVILDKLNIDFKEKDYIFV